MVLKYSLSMTKLWQAKIFIIVSKQESSDVDELKQRVKELEDLLKMHNVSTFTLAKVLITMIHMQIPWKNCEDT